MFGWIVVFGYIRNSIRQIICSWSNLILLFLGRTSLGKFNPFFIKGIWIDLVLTWSWEIINSAKVLFGLAHREMEIPLNALIIVPWTRNLVWSLFWLKSTEFDTLIIYGGVIRLIFSGTNLINFWVFTVI